MGRAGLDMPDVEEGTANDAQSDMTRIGGIDCTVSNAIDYLYLDFNTELATTPVFPDGLQKDYPKCPNVKQYDTPFSWSMTRKNLMTWICCATNACAAWAAGSYAAPEAQLTEKWNISRVKFEIGITVFTIGFGIGPMFLAPFSELNGRRPVFLATGLLFVVCQLGCALTDSYGGMLAARLFAGIGGSTFSTMVGGILADIWTPAERNTPMVIFTGATLFGTGLGPLVSGFIAQRLLWRWVFWVQLIVSGFIVSLVAITFRETRQPIILAKKAKILNKWYEKLESAGAIGLEMPNKASSNSSYEKLPRVSAQRVRYKVLAEETRPSLGQMLKISLTRPAILLVTEPILICFSAWISFDWAVLYLEFGALPLVFQTNYGFNLEQSFAVFAAVSIGGIFATVISIYQDKWAVKKFGKRFTGRPEGRLWFTCAWGLMLPIGLFWFGFTCYPSVHWIVPCIALVFITIGIFSIFLATFNYIADCYQSYASSALAAAGVCRNFLAGGITLVVVQMFQAMGYQAASSTLGGIGLILALGPILLIWFGARVRLKSRVAHQFVKDDEI